jgi:hypothetical protein
MDIDSTAALLVYLIVFGLGLYISYLMIRAAVRSGVKWAVRDVLEDPGLRRQLVDLVDPARADAE